MSKPTYEDLVDVLTRVWKTTKIESALSVEWANYPVEVFEEIIDIVTQLQLEDVENDDKWDKEDRPVIRKIDKHFEKLENE